MLALGGNGLRESMNGHIELGKAITHTCHESYDRTNTKLGPDAFRFLDGIEAMGLRGNKISILCHSAGSGRVLFCTLATNPRSSVRVSRAISTMGDEPRQRGRREQRLTPKQPCITWKWLLKSSRP